MSILSQDFQDFLKQAVGPVAFSPDGRTLASGGDGAVELWNLDVKQEVATLSGGTGVITCLTFSTDGRTLVTSIADATICLWRAATEEDVLNAAALGLIGDH